MENFVAQQLTALGVSALLGAAAGLIYDLLRTVRLRRRSLLLTHLTDVIYVLLLMLGLFRLALSMGAGELRLYMMVGALLGAVLYFWLPARLLRPLWEFWLGVAVSCGRLLWRPVAIFQRIAKKVWSIVKKHFPFRSQYSKIKLYMQKFAQISWRERRKGAAQHGKGQKKTKKQR